MLKSFWSWWLRRNKWAIVGQIPPDLKKSVIIVAPHTSSTDFFVGLAVRSVKNMSTVRFLGKKELFRPPFGFIFRWLGGTPVDRSSQHNMVDQVVQKFKDNDAFSIAISPEGTRKKVDRLRTGFYHIALKAKVPIIMAALDFANKQVVFSEPFMPSGQMAEDFKKILDYFGPVQGKIPENGLAHLQKNPPAFTSDET